MSSPNGESSQKELQIKAIENELMSVKDRDLFLIYQKTRKISAVLFRLAGMISSEKLLGDKLRQSSLNLIGYCADLERASLAFREVQKLALRAGVMEVLSLLEVASFSDLISPMNISILRRELSELLKNISSLGNDKKVAALNFEKYLGEVSSEFGRADTSTVNVPNGVKDTKQYLKDKAESAFQEDTHPPLDLDIEKDKLKDFSSVAVKKNRRQSLVINLLKKKKEIMIKDLMGVITDCSEKTIQRELSALVESGLLKKTGERRWTRYSLAK